MWRFYVQQKQGQPIILEHKYGLERLVGCVVTAAEEYFTLRVDNDKWSNDYKPEKIFDEVTVAYDAIASITTEDAC